MDIMLYIMNIKNVITELAGLKPGFLKQNNQNIQLLLSVHDIFYIIPQVKILDSGWSRAID